VSIGVSGGLRMNDGFELQQLIHRYTWGIDSVDPELLSRVFCEDVRVEFLSPYPDDPGITVTGLPAVVEGLAERAREREGWGGVPWHFVSNELIEIDGDRAEIRAFMHNRHARACGTYRFEAIRRPEGWRIDSMSFTGVARADES